MIKQREKTLVRKQQIVAAAKKLILKYGSEHVTVRRMANEIGVSEGAIYRHFNSKNEILSFLLMDVEKALVTKVDHQDLNNNGFFDIEDILMYQIGVIKQRKGIPFQVLAEVISLGDRNLSNQAYEVINKFVNQIKNTLLEGIERGYIKPDVDVEAIAVIAFGMIQGLATIWTLSHYSMDIEQKYRYLWNLLRQSIMKS